MRDFAIVFVHLIVTLVRLARPGGLRSVVAESVLVRVAVGISVARYPPHRSPRAALLHKMCSSTLHAICGHENYVAPSEQLLWNEWPAHGEGHISRMPDTGRASLVRKEIRSCSKPYSGILQSLLDIRGAGLQTPENSF